MIVKPSHLRPIPSYLLPFTAQSTTQIRPLSVDFSQATQQPQKPTKAPRIPRPTPFVPDVPTFLSLFGRNLSQHASKFPSWTALFGMTGSQMEDLGIGPPRTRKYLLACREKFRNGIYGPGGNLQYVKKGEAELQIVEVPISPESLAPGEQPYKRKIIVNVPPGGSVADLKALPEKKIPGLKIKHGNAICGPYILPTKGQGRAKIAVKEGMWEVKRGRKIDGGERRRAEVRAKRRGEEKRAAAGTAR